MQQDDNPPPSLAAFCPADPSLVVYTGYGVEKELSFYSLAKKQVSTVSTRVCNLFFIIIITIIINNLFFDYR